MSGGVDNDQHDQILNALTERALTGDLDAARLVLAQPRRIKVLSRDDEDFSVQRAFRGVWDALATGVITVPEARDLLEIISRVESHL